MAASDETTTRQEAPNSLQQLASDIVTLVRQEVELAKTELADKAKAAGLGAGMLSASAVTGLITLACLSALLIIALALVIPLWAAALIVPHSGVASPLRWRSSVKGRLKMPPPSSPSRRSRI